MSHGDDALLVLVASPDNGVRDRVGGILRSLGHRTAEVGDPASALDRLASGTVDMALVDPDLGDPAPDALLATMHARLGDRTPPPVVGLSEDGETCLAVGLAGHIPPDAAADQFATLMGKWLGEGPGEGEQWVDLDHLREYTMDDGDLAAELAGLFFEGAEEYLASMAEDADDDTWWRAAHGLKGAARGFGAVVVSRLAEEAERLIGPLVGRRAGQLAKLRRAIAETRTFCTAAGVVSGS